MGMAIKTVSLLRMYHTEKWIFSSIKLVFY